MFLLTAACFDQSGRPLDSGFYTGSPAYHSLLYRIFQQQSIVNNYAPSPDEEADKQVNCAPSPDEAADKQQVNYAPSPDEAAEAPMTWAKKDKMENILAEELSDNQVS